MNIANEVIRAYLAEHGPMSGRDICDDKGLEEWEVTQALVDGVIIQCDPLPGGVSPWYRVA